MRRWRVLGAAALGLLVTYITLVNGRLAPGLASLIGWNAAGFFYLATTLRMLLRDDEATVRRRAAVEDEGATVTQTIIISAVIASLAAAVLALRESKAAAAHNPIAPPWALAFSISTLLLSWVIVQTVFALHYAHRYFGDEDKDGEADAGVKFPGQSPRTYHDFIYMAVCIGASAQVSDFNIMNTGFRRLVTLHALLAFFFNTMVLALGINILAAIISG